MRRLLVLICTVALIASCAGERARSRGTLPPLSSAAETTDGGTDGTAAFPAQCTSTPYTVVAQRDGNQPAGSATYGVIGATALPIPLVPDKAQALAPERVRELGASTDLLGYVLFFGDESFGSGDVSLFGGYGPTLEGKSRGNIVIVPNSTAPLAAGDVLTAGSIEALGMLTTFNRVNIDFKATPTELTAYLDTIAGSVTILGLSDAAICLDVKLSWAYSDGSGVAGGTLTFEGTFTAPLGERTTPFT